jgi:hypothetical protein
VSIAAFSTQLSNCCGNTLIRNTYAFRNYFVRSHTHIHSTEERVVKAAVKSYIFNISKEKTQNIDILQYYKHILLPTQQLIHTPFYLSLPLTPAPDGDANIDPTDFCIECLLYVLTNVGVIPPNAK